MATRYFTTKPMVLAYIRPIKILDTIFMIIIHVLLGCATATDRKMARPKKRDTTKSSHSSSLSISPPSSSIPSSHFFTKHYIIIVENVFESNKWNRWISCISIWNGCISSSWWNVCFRVSSPCGLYGHF